MAFDNPVSAPVEQQQAPAVTAGSLLADWHTLNKSSDSSQQQPQPDAKGFIEISDPFSAVSSPAMCRPQTDSLKLFDANSLPNSSDVSNDSVNGAQNNSVDYANFSDSKQQEAGASSKQSTDKAQSTDKTQNTDKTQSTDKTQGSSDVNSELSKLEKDICDPKALDSKDSAFAKELEHARQTMSPKEFAELCKRLQNYVNNCMAQNSKPEELPVMNITWNKDGTVKSLSVDATKYSGEQTEGIHMGSDGHVQHHRDAHGIEANPTSDPISTALTEWWTTPVQAAVDAYNAVTNTRLHRDKNGNVVR